MGRASPRNYIIFFAEQPFRGLRLYSIVCTGKDKNRQNKWFIDSGSAFIIVQHSNTRTDAELNSA